MFEWCQMKRFKQASETQSAVELTYLNVQSNMLSEKIHLLQLRRHCFS